jgi:hypothetical protein
MYDKLIDEFCQKEIINSSLFQQNSSKLLEPNFNIESFLCEIVKLAKFENISPILAETGLKFPKQSTNFDGLSSVGDPRASLGLTLSAAYNNFMPRNIVYTETLKYGARQIIDNIVCDLDGNPIKVQVSGDIKDEPLEVKQLEVNSILKDNSVLFPNYDFTKTICLTQPPIQIAEWTNSVDFLDNLSVKDLPDVPPFSQQHSNIFLYDYTLDLCTTDLNVNSVFVKTSAEEYTKFTEDFTNYGKEQHLNYFIAFLKKFFINRGWVITLNNTKHPPLFYLKISKISGDKLFNTQKVDNLFKYTSNVKNVYLKYWQDRLESISKILNIRSVLTDISTSGVRANSNSMSRSLTDPIPDYRRIMKSASLQESFYKYVRKYYTEIPQYESTTTETKTPKLLPYVNN